jgi:hypothetical protein
LKRSALAKARQQKEALHRQWFGTLCAWALLDEHFEEAHLLRKRELSRIQGHTRFDYECRCQIECCKLLSQQGLLTEANIEADRLAARKLCKPEIYQGQLARILDRDASG